MYTLEETQLYMKISARICERYGVPIPGVCISSLHRFVASWFFVNDCFIKLRVKIPGNHEHTRKPAAIPIQVCFMLIIRHLVDSSTSRTSNEAIPRFPETTGVNFQTSSTETRCIHQNLSHFASRHVALTRTDFKTIGAILT